MEYVKIEDNRVVELISTTAKMGEPWVPVKLEGGINTGADVRNYDEEWNLRPVQDRIDDGLITLKVAKEGSDYIVGTVLEHVVDNQIVAYTDKELAALGARELTKYERMVDGVVVDLTPYDVYNEGIDPLPEGLYLDHENREVISADEVETLYNEGKTTQAVWDAYQTDMARFYIIDTIAEVDAVATNPIRWGGLTAEQQQELIGFRKELVLLKNSDLSKGFQLPPRPTSLDVE